MKKKFSFGALVAAIAAAVTPRPATAPADPWLMAALLAALENEPNVNGVGWAMDCIAAARQNVQRREARRVEPSARIGEPLRRDNKR